MKVFVAIHKHSQGISVAAITSSGQDSPTPEQVISAWDIDYNPDLGETLQITEIAEQSPHVDVLPGVLRL